MISFYLYSLRSLMGYCAGLKDLSHQPSMYLLPLHRFHFPSKWFFYAGFFSIVQAGAPLTSFFFILFLTSLIYVHLTVIHFLSPSHLAFLFLNNRQLDFANLDSFNFFCPDSFSLIFLFQITFHDSIVSSGSALLLPDTPPPANHEHALSTTNVVKRSHAFAVFGHFFLRVKEFLETWICGLCKSDILQPWKLDCISGRILRVNNVPHTLFSGKQCQRTCVPTRIM